MKKHVPLSILYTLLIVYALGYLSIELFENYGWTLFLLAPFLLGFLPSFIISNVEPVSKKKSFTLGFLSLSIACFGLIVLGIEGVVCIFLSLPLFLVATFFGVLLVHRVNAQKIYNPKFILVIILAYILSFFTLDYVSYTDDLIPVTSSITIEAPIDTVWKNTIKNTKISKPDLLLDKFGITYPKEIIFTGEGIDAIRVYNFSTGSYLQSVTKWEPPHLLAFATEKLLRIL